MQHLATFGTTIINYYVITEPIYSDIDESKKETVVRTGKVNSGKPEIVTPTYALNLKGFRMKNFILAVITVIFIFFNINSTKAEDGYMFGGIKVFNYGIETSDLQEINTYKSRF